MSTKHHAKRKLSASRTTKLARVQLRDCTCGAFNEPPCPTCRDAAETLREQVAATP